MTEVAVEISKSLEILVSDGAVDKGLYSACFLATAGVRRRDRRVKGRGTELHLLMCE